MRQLAAIVFADMVGYTALMQVNESLARQKRARFRDVLDDRVGMHRGQILQHYGDGCLFIFNSALDAVNCAVDIQRDVQQEPNVELRIGIHSGDINIEDGAVYGDGVNLASRIESLAISGSVLISERVQDDIKNHNTLSTKELGHFEFKNVVKPMKVFAIANTGIVVPSRSSLHGKTQQPSNRVAVLPFVNMSSDIDNEYFSDGITEELLNALTKVEGLQVTSRTSVFVFKGKNVDIRDIGIQLNVDKVLEGSVRKSGNRVRITAQLINAVDGYHLWSETYDRQLTDIFEVQDEISGIIANKLRENLDPDQRDLHGRQAVRNVEAYTNYLRGLHFWNRLTPADNRHALECFEQAIALEPGYALAHAMIALTYSALGSSGNMVPEDAFKLVKQHADRAIELDDKIPEGYVAKASAFLMYEWKWKEGYEALKEAKRVSPGSTAASRLLSFYYVIKGERDLAVAAMEEAVKSDPLSAIMSHALANVYLFGERYDDAIRQADKILEINPTMRSSIEIKAWATGMKGNWQGALEYFQEVHRLTNHPLKGLMGLGFALGKLGRREEAMECVAKLEQRQIEEPGTLIDADLLTIWLGLGDVDKVIYYIEQCVEKRMAPIIYYIQYPFFKSVRDDPRYQEIADRIAVN
ncbi:adenylate/guanylate cyclase domain-containing protein [Chryseolinea sp. T2]|uniref:adenylate/guanylate cyclase domain-containing protein n=1 Tax=Chryseolinea sp. T2 TaxID=3129255 RepID=UPI0030783F90